MWLIWLALLLAVIAFGWMVYKFGFKETWGAVVAFVVSIAAGAAAFWDQLTGGGPPVLP